MAKLRLPKKIRVEDYEQEERELVGKLAGSINDFFQDVSTNFDGRVDFTNLNRQLVEIVVRIDGSGNLLEAPQVRLNLKSKIAGINCIYAENTQNPAIYPNSLPFISFVFNGDLLTIRNISGLPNNSEYFLRLELIGF